MTYSKHTRIAGMLIFTLFLFNFGFADNFLQNHSKINVRDSLNIDMNKCDWILNEKLLTEKEKDSVKAFLYKKPHGLVVKTVSNLQDSILKYHVKKSCVVILGKE